MFRFLIALVNIDQTNLSLSIIESKIVEAPDFNAAAVAALESWPEGQVSVSRIGRILGQNVTDTLPMGQSGG